MPPDIIRTGAMVGRITLASASAALLAEISIEDFTITISTADFAVTPSTLAAFTLAAFTVAAAIAAAGMAADARTNLAPNAACDRRAARRVSGTKNSA
jgi:hypothetical protein